MRIIETKDYNDMSKKAANILTGNRFHTDRYI